MLSSAEILNTCTTITRDGVMHLLHIVHSGDLRGAQVRVACGREMRIHAHELGVYPPYPTCLVCPTCKAVAASAVVRGVTLSIAAHDWHGSSVVPEEDV